MSTTPAAFSCVIGSLAAVRRAVVAGGALVGVTTAVFGLRRRYRRDLAAARDRLHNLASEVIQTEFGRLEYAERGAGHPLLVSHGIFHGCDGGLLSVRDIVDERRTVVPSRFGYLGSTLPPDATGAMQADAFVALLDHLGLDTVDVVAISAGTTAATQLVLRHPERVDRLVVSSGNLPGSRTAEVPPEWAKLFYSDPAMWALMTFARPVFAKLMGVPEGLPRNASEARVVDELLASIFPVGFRAEGAIFDAYVSNPEMTGCPLEELRVPVLLVHARDDPLAAYDAAVEASQRIPDAVLVGLDSGGHLQLGQAERVRSEIRSFLTRRGAERFSAPQV